MKPTKVIQGLGPGPEAGELGPALRRVLHDQARRHGNAAVDLPIDHRGAWRTHVGHAEPTSWRCLSVHPAPISKVDRMTTRRRHRINSPNDPFVTGFSEPTVGHIRGPLPGRCLRPVRSDIKGRADTSEQVILVERLAQVANDPSPQRALPPAVVGVSCY